MHSSIPTRHRRVRPAPRRSGQPLTQAEIDDIAMCRCKLLPDCHQSLHCKQEHAKNGGATR
jgi:hypothetical protein